MFLVLDLRHEFVSSDKVTVLDTDDGSKEVFSLANCYEYLDNIYVESSKEFYMMPILSSVVTRDLVWLHDSRKLWFRGYILSFLRMTLFCSYSGDTILFRDSIEDKVFMRLKLVGDKLVSDNSFGTGFCAEGRCDLNTFLRRCV